MRHVVEIAKALAGEQRIRALAALAEGELCVCELIEVLRLAPSTVSKHMSILRQARLIEARKEGRWVYYRLARRSASQYVASVIRWVLKSLEGDPNAAELSERARAARRMRRDELCKHYGA